MILSSFDCKYVRLLFCNLAFFQFEIRFQN